MRIPPRAVTTEIATAPNVPTLHAVSTSFTRPAIRSRRSVDPVTCHLRFSYRLPAAHAQAAYVEPDAAKDTEARTEKSCRVFVLLIEQVYSPSCRRPNLVVARRAKQNLIRVCR